MPTPADVFHLFANYAGGRVMFWCPGCDEYHGVDTQAGGQGPVWGFNGDFVRPTLTPSILVRHGTDRVCHSFVKDGKIQFLGDCNHHLAGQTLPLIPWDDCGK